MFTAIALFFGAIILENETGKLPVDFLPPASDFQAKACKDEMRLVKGTNVYYVSTDHCR